MNVTDSATIAPSAQMSEEDLAYRTSRWHRLLWKEFRSEMAEPELLRQAENPNIAAWPKFQRETFARLYSEHVSAIDEQNSAGWAKRAHGAAEQLPEWEQLRERVRGDQVWSGLAALSVGEQVAAALPKPPPEAKADVEKLERQVEGLQDLAQKGLDVKAELGQAQQQLGQAKAAMEKFAKGVDESALRQAMRKAIAKANEDIDQAQETAAAFGYGDQSGTAGKSGTAAERAQILKRIRNSKKLAQIAAEAGRLRRIAARKQRDKVRHTPDEVVDVEMGDNLSRVLPSELARLRHPLTRLTFLRDFTEKRLLQYRMDGKEPEGRGPIIVAIDNSGSMRGQPEVWSKAVALALLDIAMRQKRAFAVLHWSYGVDYELFFEAGQASPEKLLEAMDYFSGGGTSLAAPAMRACDIVRTNGSLKKADLILITDGDASVEGAEAHKTAAKELGMTTYGVLIGSGERDRRILEAWSDQVVTIGQFTHDDAVHETIFTI